MEME
jgi:hypothetical protein